MPDPAPAALSFLRTRRSRPAKTLGLPVPSHAELRPLLEAALRCPDHGKLEPWRLVVLERAALDRLAGLVPESGARLDKDAGDIVKQTAQFANADLAVAVISSPVPSTKIPQVEQAYSAACVAYGLLSAALAAGWGANWLSGWASHDATFARDGLGLAEHEVVTGFIHIGTETATPPERPRPDLDARTTWMTA